MTRTRCRFSTGRRSAAWPCWRTSRTRSWRWRASARLSRWPCTWPGRRPCTWFRIRRSCAWFCSRGLCARSGIWLRARSCARFCTWSLGRIGWWFLNRSPRWFITSVSIDPFISWSWFSVCHKLISVTCIRVSFIKGFIRIILKTLRLERKSYIFFIFDKTQWEWISMLQMCKILTACIWV